MSGDLSGRRAGKMRADMRALEEEAERENILGAGATPSMGLSQFRGGAMLGEAGHGLQRKVGAGTKKGQPRKTARKAFEKIGKMEVAQHKAEHEALGEDDSDAEMMGSALGKHIHTLKGAGFFDDFAKGFMSVVRPVANVASFLPGPAGMVGKVVSGFGKTGAGYPSGAYEGQGMEGCGKVDGRKARAEVVKRVMKERGVSMVEASKIVKAEGLYKK